MVLTTARTTVFRLRKQLSHPAQQFIDADRLREPAVEFHEVLGIEFGRDEHDFNVRELGAYPTAQSHAVYVTRHAYVRHHKPNIIAARQYGHRFVAVGRFDNCVSSLAQFLCQMQPDEDLILHNEYRTLCQALPLSYRRQFDCRSPSRVTLNSVRPNQFQGMVCGID
ncbi:hypothetical protein HYPP_03269 [Hyphomicrobium sp. ghe19]|nr:hypothetical protein HYPP_03269 [Hyphomicrobium sp. ghe19]